METKHRYPEILRTPLEAKDLVGQDIVKLKTLYEFIWIDASRMLDDARVVAERLGEAKENNKSGPTTFLNYEYVRAPMTIRYISQVAEIEIFWNGDKVASRNQRYCIPGAWVEFLEPIVDEAYKDMAEEERHKLMRQLTLDDIPGADK